MLISGCYGILGGCKSVSRWLLWFPTWLIGLLKDMYQDKISWVHKPLQLLCQGLSCFACYAAHAFAARGTSHWGLCSVFLIVVSFTPPLGGAGEPVSGSD